MELVIDSLLERLQQHNIHVQSYKKALSHYMEQKRYIKLRREADRILRGEATSDLQEIEDLEKEPPPQRPIFKVLPAEYEMKQVCKVGFGILRDLEQETRERIISMGYSPEKTKRELTIAERKYAKELLKDDDKLYSMFGHCYLLDVLDSWKNYAEVKEKEDAEEAAVAAGHTVAATVSSQSANNDGSIATEPAVDNSNSDTPAEKSGDPASSSSSSQKVPSLAISGLVADSISQENKDPNAIVDYWKKIVETVGIDTPLEKGGVTGSENAKKSPVADEEGKEDEEESGREDDNSSDN